MIRRNEVWILTVSGGSKCPGGKHEIISESHCSLKMKSSSILDIGYFRRINQSWNEISVVHSSLLTKFCFWILHCTAGNNISFCHSKAPQHNVLDSGWNSQEIPTFLFHYFHIPFHSNNTLWAPFTPLIPISKWPYTSLCMPTFCQGRYYCFKRCLFVSKYLWEGNTSFPTVVSLCFKPVFDGVYIAAAAGSSLHLRLAVSQNYCANTT